MFLRLPVRKTAPFLSITAEKQTFKNKKQEEQRSNHACYTLSTQISEPKIFRSGYPVGANVLEQENIRALSLKNRFTGKRRRAKITILPCSFRVFSLAAFLPW